MSYIVIASKVMAYGTITCIVMAYIVLALAIVCRYEPGVKGEWAPSPNDLVWQRWSRIDPRLDTERSPQGHAVRSGQPAPSSCLAPSQCFGMAVDRESRRSHIEFVRAAHRSAPRTVWWICSHGIYIYGLGLYIAMAWCGHGVEDWRVRTHMLRLQE